MPLVAMRVQESTTSGFVFIPEALFVKAFYCDATMQAANQTGSMAALESQTKKENLQM
jgi:hypothetical protein